MFNSDEFKNKAFEIKNNSFRNIFEYYLGIKFENNNINDCDNIQIDFDKIPRINKEITKDEFKYLWINANRLEKIEIVRLLKFHWMNDFLRNHGIKNFVKKVIDYV